ncbi:terpenoid cyclases/protein prenyltransferase alpha-alpha toroid [Cyathus striatus]|nr:terpenoid cyclases/protein prenyltransferase alpha-alpha toroid [Cyathus striatus]
MSTKPLHPTPIDAFSTPTSDVQYETESILLKHFPPTPNDTPELNKNAHLQYLVRNLVQGFPERYTSQDASQPWLLFWTLQGFSALQVAMDPGNRQKAIDTIMTWQHPDGGFGGGPGQAPHLLATYAAVSALAIVGRPGPNGGWDQIDRKKLYSFFMSVKQPDGSFLVAKHMEVDVRGIYCLLNTATLLDLLTPELVKGTADFLASCQTYEGGFASASHPSYEVRPPRPEYRTSSKPRVLASPRPALGEAHGGYTFCALAGWVLLLPFTASSDTAPTLSLRLKPLLRWLTSMQCTRASLGGFRGRTNKLVDGCYSWWCGGSFALLEALGVGGIQNASLRAVEEEERVLKDEEGKKEMGRGGREKEKEKRKADEDGWVDVDDSLYDQKALQEYLLYAGQHPAGGLRDKPPKNADAYHTLYCLSGLSAAQHHVFPSKARQKEIEDAWVSKGHYEEDNLRRRVFSSMLSWVEEEGASRILGGKGNRVNATHPVTNLTMTHTEGIMSHFYNQRVPPRGWTPGLTGGKI